MAYTDDLNSIHNPATGTQAPATWGDAIRANFLCQERVVAHTVLGGAASSIASSTLATVTNGWQLRIVVRAQHATTTAQNIGLRFNGDTGSNYSRSYVLGQDSTLSGDSEATATSLPIGSCGNESANRWSICEGIVFDYLGSGHKGYRGHAVDWRSLATSGPAGCPVTLEVSGLWASTSAITSVTVVAASGNFASGSSLTVLATPSV